MFSRFLSLSILTILLTSVMAWSAQSFAQGYIQPSQSLLQGQASYMRSMGGDTSGAAIMDEKGAASVGKPHSYESLEVYDIAPAYAEPVNLASAELAWTAREGQKLKDVLSVWATKDGYGLVWDTKYNYVLTADYRSGDTFFNAVEGIMNEFRKSSKHPKGVVHMDAATGENFLVVQTKGER